MMDSPNDKSPFSATEPSPGARILDPAVLPETAHPVRTDRLYQIAALTAGLILLATAL
ncbi:MAG TPA: hypothetical protein VFE22_12555 [Edaphobacter sp.]|jgi:hypothetical protein|nr:hypothetical protein [Edaphobacter sp.]